MKGFKKREKEHFLLTPFQLFRVSGGNERPKKEKKDLKTRSVPGTKGKGNLGKQG